jgi:hypothetical protein
MEAPMFLTTLRRWGYRLRQKLRGAPTAPPPQRPADPRVDQSPWLSRMLDALGARYRLGEDKPDGIQLVRRTGKERFNPMRVYLRPAENLIACDYDMRVRGEKSLADGRAILDRRVTEPLGKLGLTAASESVEVWGGHVIVRRYQGACPDPLAAANAIRFVCERSDQVMDTEAE